MKNKSVAILDFASEMNRGDAAMQETIIELVNNEFPEIEQNIISVYGSNQKETFDKHFDCSIAHGAKIYPGVRKTYNALGGSASEAKHKKIKNLINMAICYMQLVLYKLLGVYLSFDDAQKESLAKIKDADFVVWNGRNFRDRKGIGEVYDLLAMLLHPLYAFASGKKVFAIGVSIWPLQYKISNVLLKYALKKCAYVSAREENAYSYATDVLKLDNVTLKPDLSYYFIRKYFNANREENTKRVSMTLVDWTEDGYEVRDRYIQSMRTLANHLVSKGYHIDVVPQVFFEWESYNDLIDQIFCEISDKSKVTLIKDYLVPEQLFAQYVKSDFLIATRMHSAIFALTHRTKVLSIPYDAGGKWAILTNMGMDKAYSIDYQVVTPSSIVERFEQLESDDEYFNEIDVRLPTLFEDVNTNISDIKKFI